MSLATCSLRLQLLGLGCLALTILSGCPQSSTPSPAPTNNQKDNQKNNPNTPQLTPAQASAEYGQWCASCHGTFGEGGIGPKLTDWTKSRQALVDAIDKTMPTNQPEQCVGACAEGIADLILKGFENQSCDPKQVVLPPRRVRLLNRIEYTQTIRDLFAPYVGQQMANTMCLDTGTCDDPATQSCQGGLCQPRACDQHLFVYDDGGQQLNTVHVAGSFNQWPPQQAQGGLAMTYAPKHGVWLADTTLTEGTHLYKFVLNDQTWITDPTNPNRQDDGFGGSNAVLNISCEANAPNNTFDQDWAEGLPGEQKQEGFSFDNSVETLFVGTLQLDTYLKNGKTLGALAKQHINAIATCTKGQRSCAEQTATTFGLRAFRRPLNPEEINAYTNLIMAQENFDDGIATMVRAMLSSPHFLYRFELGTKQQDGSYKLTPYELASALSYLYWGTMPDDALFELAKQNKLHDPNTLNTQARRLLADPRARTTLGRFAEQWLGIENVRTKAKNNVQFPQFTNELRRAMLRETQLFFTDIALDPQAQFAPLFTANYTFANKTLAQFYGLTGPQNDSFERVMDTTGKRNAGVLTHASVLSAYAHSDQTSPILRGLFVRGHLLCQDFPPPPANAGNVPEVDGNATTRERINQHSDDPSCNSCHKLIDPVGFGFEHYDPIGQWRQSDAGQPIDASGDILDIEGFGQGTSTPFNGVEALGQQLASTQSAPRCMTQQWFRFTYGYKESLGDRCTIDALNTQFKAKNYTIYELLVAITQHPSFQNRQ